MGWEYRGVVNMLDWNLWKNVHHMEKGGGGGCGTGQGCLGIGAEGSNDGHYNNTQMLI